MAWRLNKSVVKGELDNRRRGQVIGKVWLAGQKDPIELEMDGNPLRDMAGCRVTFTNPAPAVGEPTDLSPTQIGVVGDMTASRKVRIPDVPVDEMMALAKAGKTFPEHLANGIYLEWFSRQNGRVVIESVDYEISISGNTWKMCPAEEEAQLKANAAAIQEYLGRIDELVANEPSNNPHLESPLGDDDDDEYEAMDEFQWEKFMKDSDRRTDRYMELLDKYEGHPDREKIVAHEMGWTWLEEALDAEERGKLEPEKDAEGKPTDDILDDLPDLEPDPATEGVDWVRDESGHPNHPLVLRASKLSVAMWQYCDRSGLLGEAADDELHDMLFNAQMTGAKLAGALNSICYDHIRDGGFVVASLKRALNYLHQAIGLVDTVAAKSLVDAGELAAFKTGLFGIREEILALMERFRKKV